MTDQNSKLLNDLVKLIDARIAIALAKDNWDGWTVRQVTQEVYEPLAEQLNPLFEHLEKSHIKY